LRNLLPRSESPSEEKKERCTSNRIEENVKEETSHLRASCGETSWRLIGRTQTGLKETFLGNQRLAQERAPETEKPATSRVKHSNDRSISRARGKIPPANWFLQINTRGRKTGEESNSKKLFIPVLINGVVRGEFSGECGEKGDRSHFIHTVWLKTRNHKKELLRVKNCKGKRSYESVNFAIVGEKCAD